MGQAPRCRLYIKAKGVLSRHQGPASPPGSAVPALNLDPVQAKDTVNIPPHSCTSPLDAVNVLITSPKLLTG